MTQIVVDVYQLEVGIPKADQKLVLHGKSVDAFKSFCAESWEKSLDLVDQARQRQKTRETVHNGQQESS